MSHRSNVMVKKTYMHLAVVTLVCASVWTVVTIYSALIEPGIVEVEADVLTPINPKLDETVLNLLTNYENVAKIPFEPPVIIPKEEVATINEISPSIVEVEEIAPQESSESAQQL